MELAKEGKFELRFFDLVLARDPDGKAVANVPHEIVRHSPTGFEWGYGGSGPSELALNALAAMVGEARASKNGLYQLFKAEFLAGVPYQGGTIKAESIMNWYEHNRPKRDYAREAAREREKFDQFKAKLGKEQGARFRAHLAEHGIGFSEWFKYAVSLGLVPGRDAPGSAALASGAESDALADGAARPVAQEPAPVSGALPAKKRRAPSPSLETVRGWAAMCGQGMSFQEIAAKDGAYEASTIRKRVRALAEGAS